jgi:hypothetical protein
MLPPSPETPPRTCSTSHNAEAWTGGRRGCRRGRISTPFSSDGSQDHQRSLRRSSRSGGAETTVAAGEEPLRVPVGVHVVEDPQQVVPVLFARIRHVLAAHADGEGDLRKGPVGDVSHSTKAPTKILRPPECRRIAFRASPQLAVGSRGCDLASWLIPREACKES